MITLESRPESIEIEFQLTWAQRRAAAEAVMRAFRRKLGLDRHRRRLDWLGAGLVLAAIGGAALSGAAPAQMVAIALAIAAAPLVIGGRWLLKRIEHERTGPLPSRRALRQNWRLGPEGVDITFGKSRMHLAWADVRDVRPIDGLVLLFLDQAQYLIVPDAAFMSRNHRRRFLAYLRVALEVTHPRRRRVARAA